MFSQAEINDAPVVSFLGWRGGTIRYQPTKASAAAWRGFIRLFFFQAFSWSSSAFASLRSAVSKPY